MKHVVYFSGRDVDIDELPSSITARLPCARTIAGASLVKTCLALILGQLLIKQDVASLFIQLLGWAGPALGQYERGNCLGLLAFRGPALLASILFTVID